MIVPKWARRQSLHDIPSAGIGNLANYGTYREIRAEKFGKPP